MSDQKAQIIGELQRKGKRITGQRKILLDVILEGKWSSCKEIYYMASKKDPTIGLATVYRMVGVLEEAEDTDILIQLKIRSAKAGIVYLQKLPHGRFFCMHSKNRLHVI